MKKFIAILIAVALSTLFVCSIPTSSRQASYIKVNISGIPFVHPK